MSQTTDLSHVKALVFDVFGTVVDWRSSLIADFTGWSAKRGVTGDWAGLVDAWRQAYKPSMDAVRKNPALGFKMLDTLHRASLEKLVAQFSIKGLTDDDLDYMTKGWHRLKPWPDVVSGLTRLKTKFIIGTLSNGRCVLMKRRCVCASSLARSASMGPKIVASSQGAFMTTGLDSGVWKIRRSTIRCVQVVPHLGNVAITMSPLRGT